MRIDVLAANVSDGLGRPEAAGQLLDEFNDLRPHIAFFSEARNSKLSGFGHYNRYAANPYSVAEVSSYFDNAGYEQLWVPNDDQDDRTDRHHTLAVVDRSRFDDIEMEVVNLGHRNGTQIAVTDTETGLRRQFVGAHGPDRGTDARNAFVDAIRNKVEAQQIDVLLGDLNAAPTVYRESRLIRQALRAPAVLLPSEEPRRGAHIWNPRRLGNIASRLHDMASDGMLDDIVASGLQLGPDKSPTFHAKVPLLRLDHILTGAGVKCEWSETHRSQATNHLMVVSGVRFVETGAEKS